MISLSTDKTKTANLKALFDSLTGKTYREAYPVFRENPTIQQWIARRGTLKMPDELMVKFFHSWANGETCPPGVFLFMEAYGEILQDTSRPRDYTNEVEIFSISSVVDAPQAILSICPGAPEKVLPKEGAFSRHACLGSLPEGKKIFFDSDDEGTV